MKNNSITEKQQEIIDDIIDNFDFEKVNKTMNFLDWQWASGLNNYYNPEISDLKKCARELMRNCFVKNLKCCSSGGFQVEKVSNNILILKFVITEYENN